MFKWFRERRRDIKFTHCFEKVAIEQFDEGILSYRKLEECRRAADNPRIMRRARQQMMASDGLLGGVRLLDLDWAAILTWFRDYFIPAMRIIIPMIMLLQDADETSSPP